MKTVLRFHYRAKVKDRYDRELFNKAIEECQQSVSWQICNDKILTCALFRYQNMLFLYMEFIVEKEASQNASDNAPYTQLTETIFQPLSTYLKVWPGIYSDRVWVPMYHIYCFAYPESLEEWRRPIPPEQRCGRIAFFHDDKLYSYIYHHYAIVQEGCYQGDKYQSIALHENIAFSYFETPRDRYITNVKRHASQESIALQNWNSVDPKSHFIQLTGSKGENFLIIPCLFALSND